MVYKMLFAIIIKLVTFVATCESAKILAIFPSPFLSHQYVFRPLTQELARRGHEVTVITPIPAFEDETPKNLREIDVSGPSYDYMNNFKITITEKANDIYVQADTLFDLFADVFEEQVKAEVVQQLINRKEEFDLLIIEACVRPALVFSHIFKAPVITISSLGSLDMFTGYLGVPTHPILHPTNLHQRLHKLSFWEKAKEIYKHYYIEGMLKNKEERENEMLKKHFGDDVPSLSELKKNIALLMLNLHHIWEENRPVPPNVVYLGGGLHMMGSNTTTQLTKEFSSYLDSSVNGVVYVSLGTNVKPSKLSTFKETVLKVFAKLPYDFLVKWDEDYLVDCPHNVKVAKWMPQMEILKHPKVKLFITQGGLQSTDEAISAGVPLIGIPILGDQWYNTDQYKHFKIGLKMDLEYLTEESLLKAIVTVIEDKSYRQNIINLRAIIRDQPQSALTRAIWWTEHVIRHKGAPHLQPPGSHMSWTEYLELEMIAGVVSCLLGVFTAVAYMGIYIWKGKG